MIQDLTMNKDFLKHNDFSDVLNRLLIEIDVVSETLVSPNREMILTGTTFERESKRYALNHETDWGNMCDCCGAPIKNKPWDFEENKTLCSECERDFMKEVSDLMYDESVVEIFDDSSMINVIKPWNLVEHERENPIDNVLLWD